MKKSFALLLVLALLLSVTACSSGSSGGSSAASGSPATSAPAETSSAPATGDSGSDGKVYQIKLDFPDPASSIIGVFLTDWVKEVGTASNGRLQIELFPSSALGSVYDMVDNLINGVSDMIWTSPALYTGRFPVTEGANLPLLGIKDAKMSVDFLYYVYDNCETMQKEFSLVRPLAFYQAAPAYFSIGSKTIDGLDGLKGLQIKVQGTYPAAFVSALGGSPVSFHNSELYDALQKHVVDGFMTDITVFKSWSLFEVTQQVFENPIYRSTLFMLMNNDVYNSLPDDLKAVIDKSTGKDLGYRLADAFDKGGEEGRQLYIKQGAKVSNFMEAEIARLNEAAAQVQNTWVQDMTKQGLDGAAIMQVYKDAVAATGK